MAEAILACDFSSTFPCTDKISWGSDAISDGFNFAPAAAAEAEAEADAEVGSRLKGAPGTRPGPESNPEP